MTTTAPASDTQTFTITEEISVRASLEQTFASLVAQMGRLNENPDGAPLPMVLETRPGGRWYRDLGGDNLKFLYLDGRSKFGHYLEYTWMTDAAWDQIRAM